MASGRNPKRTALGGSSGGGSGTVTSVTAADGSITVGGTATDPTITVGLATIAKGGTGQTTAVAALTALLAGVLDPAIANQTQLGLLASFTYGASTTISAPVYYTSSSDVRPANATAIATGPCMGIACATASSGAHAVLIGPGVVRDDTNYNFGTVGGIVYLGATAGTLTQTQPSSTDNLIQIVGIALAQRVLLYLPNLHYDTHT